MGVCECFTCSRPIHFKLCHGGHYLSRTKLATAIGWCPISAINCQPQCVHCNTYQGGMPGEFRKRLVKKYGAEMVAELEALKLPKNNVWNRYELATIKQNFLDEIRSHEARLKCCG